MKKALFVAVIVALLGLGVWGAVRGASPVAKDAGYSVQTRFVLEGYDVSKENYWEGLDDSRLSQHFQLSLQRAAGLATPPQLATTTRAAVADMLEEAFASATSTEARNMIAVDTLRVALYNFQPLGRSELRTAVQEAAFRQAISNIDESKDLYQDLGVAKGASVDEVRAKAAELKAELAASSSPEAKAELERVAYAERVLADNDTRDLYDEAKIEPTLERRVVGSSLYVGMGKIAPTTLLEFVRAVSAASTTPGIDSLVIDFRGNAGGALDFAQNFVGLFVGPGQYAFDFFSKGELLPQRSQTPRVPELARFKEIAVLTDSSTMSTAEATAGALKRMRIAKTVGERTQGWGTVENTFPLETQLTETEKHALFLVHSVTLGDSQQFIQGEGIQPDVDVKDPAWKSKIGAVFPQSGIEKAIIDIYSKTQ